MAELVWNQPCGAAPGNTEAVGLLAPCLLALGVPHLFTTRNVPLGCELEGRDWKFLGATFDRGRAFLNASERALFSLHQVHGRRVFDADGPLPPLEPRADAVITSRCERLLAVKTADCVPILVAGAGGERVAAIHAGWRGLVAGIIQRAVCCFPGGGLVAAVGPCLSRAHFEVGPPVALAFRAAKLAEAVFEEPGQRAKVDLRLAALISLERAGVETIDTTQLCTWEDERWFWSHRRDVTHGGAQATGRQGALIGVRALPTQRGELAASGKENIIRPWVQPKTETSPPCDCLKSSGASGSAPRNTG